MAIKLKTFRRSTYPVVLSCDFSVKLNVKLPGVYYLFPNPIYDRVFQETINKQGDEICVLHYVCCHNYHVIRSRDVIGHMTIRLSINDFLCILNSMSRSFHH